MACLDTESRRPNQPEANVAETLTASNEKIIDRLPDPATLPDVRLYSHSSLVYWWPVWVTGYVMCLITYLEGRVVPLNETRQAIIHGSSTPGLVFTAVLLLVILITNVRLRGVASLAAILGAAFVFVLFAWLDWWDDILRVLPQLTIHLNLGFYLIFSTALLIIWLLGFFVFDRLVYWRVRPGQINEQHLIGGG